jgi:endonuclease YncB( thermonuclease family)
MPEEGQPTQPSRLRGFWGRRSRKGKIALVLGAILLLLIVAGIAAPPPEDPEPASNEAPVSSADPVSTEESAEPPTAAETTTEAAAKPPPPPPRIARVIDGDTVELESGARVRLVQIDTPELGSECFGQKSAAALRSLLPAGTKVRLVRDRALDNRDRYGRLLRYVFKGSRNLNVVLVRRGAASVWFFEGDRGRFADRLVRAAEQARNLGRGAWGACDASYDFERGWDTRRKAPPPPPAPVAASPPAADCHPSYVGACLDPYAEDYDCEGGSGNGPLYTGPVRVVGPDDFDLDRDGDGSACEDS